MRLTDHGIQIGPACGVLGDQYTVVGAQALDDLRCRLAELVDLAQALHPLLLKHGKHFHPYAGSTLGIVHGTVVILQ